MAIRINILTNISVSLFFLLITSSPLANASNTCSGIDSKQDPLRSCPPTNIPLRYLRTDSALIAVHIARSPSTVGANYRFGRVAWSDSDNTKRIHVSDGISLSIDLSEPEIYRKHWLVERLLIEIEDRKVVLEAFHPVAQSNVERSERHRQAIQVALSVVLNKE